MNQYKDKMKLYRAIIWIGDQPGQRVEILAETLEEAQEKLEAEFGTGHVFTLRNDDDASQPR